MYRIWGGAVVAVSIALLAGATYAQDACGTDYNGDGVTDEVDAEIFQAALGSEEGDENYVALADHNGDGAITTADFSHFLACN
jgi:hypothetical protein